MRNSKRRQWLIDVDPEFRARERDRSRLAKQQARANPEKYAVILARQRHYYYINPIPGRENSRRQKLWQRLERTIP